MTRRAIPILLLGVVLLLAGLAGSWAQDVAAPWVNAGEAQMGSAVAFDSSGGKYRVIISGATRPAIEQTGCTVRRATGGDLRILGGKDVNPSERLGVSRVLGFEAPAGPTSIVCADRFSRSSTLGRFQVVAADGPVSIAVLAAFGLGTVLLALGILLVVLARRRSQHEDETVP